MDVVAQAEAVMKNLPRDKWGKIFLTTSQIRKFLSAVNSLSNKINLYKIQNGAPKELDADLAAQVKYLKIKLVYQAGRERNVKEFMNKSNLVPLIDGIGTSVKAYEEFAKYVEALVAYRKFMGDDK